VVRYRRREMPQSRSAAVSSERGCRRPAPRQIARVAWGVPLVGAPAFGEIPSSRHRSLQHAAQAAATSAEATKRAAST